MPVGAWPTRWSANSSATGVEKKTGMRVGKLVDLRVHRLQHVRVTVTEARDCCAARGIDVLLARGVNETDSATAHRERQCAAKLPMQDVGHAMRSSW
jgi:hypothetical protein